MSLRFRRRNLLTGAAATLCCPHIARAARRLVRIGQGGTPVTPSGMACRAFADAVAAAPLLSGVLRVEIFDQGELGDDLPALRSAQRGSIEMVTCGSVVLATFHPTAGVLDTPFLFKDAATARRVLDGPIGDELIALLKTKGVNVLAWGENGLRHMTANKPIRKPSDLVGLRLRVPQSEVEIQSFRALGADAKAIPYLSTYAALRTGEFEAQENPIANIESARFYEVQKVLSLTTHIYSAGAFVASQDLLDELSPAQITALTAAAKQGAAAMRRTASEAERDGVARLRAQGMTIVDDVDVAAFIAAAKPNLESMGSEFGTEFMARVIRAGAGG
jgi:tripartite ATP-independent transporter DctP family solute receptor